MRVAVAGFGIGGATAALALARDGHDVSVFERAPLLGPAGAGFLLQPSGQAVLADLGLLDRVASEAWPIRTFHAESAPGRTLSELRYDRRDTTVHALGVARGRLFMALQEACLAAGVQVNPGNRVADAHERSSEVVAVDDQGAALGAFDVLVGADGMRSTLRARVDPDARLYVSTYAALWGLGINDGRCLERLSQQTRGVGLLTGLLPVGEREMAFFWGVSGGAVEVIKADGWEAFVEGAVAVFPETRCVLESIGGFEGLTLAHYGHASVSRRFTDRIVLIGDAAHPSPPHLGQGANLALLDAAALAAAFRATESSPREAFEWWDDRRRWQNWRYTLLSRALSPFFQSSHRWLEAPRDLGLPLMGAIPPLRGLMELVLAGRG